LIDKRVDDLQAALAGIGPGASIMISGFGNAGIPGNLLHGLSGMGLSGLTMILNAIRRLEESNPVFFAEGQIAHVITTAFRGPGQAPAAFERQWQDGKLTFEIVPQGTFAERIRAGGAGVPAFYTPTAAGTPLAEGREQRDFNDQTCVLETALTADVALLRAEKADRYGNLFFRGTQSNFGAAMATAARLTIVEVEEISDQTLPPAQVHLPGIYVQRVLQAARKD
jgi:3-oxoacid CoA-transferase A subunit